MSTDTLAERHLKHASLSRVGGADLVSPQVAAKPVQCDEQPGELCPRCLRSLARISAAHGAVRFNSGACQVFGLAARSAHV